MPNGFCLGGHSGRPERWSHDGSRWVAAEPSRYGFCVWGYDNDTPEVVRLGVNLSGREVERLADLFLALEEVALEAEGAAMPLGSSSAAPVTSPGPKTFGTFRTQESCLPASAFPGTAEIIVSPSAGAATLTTGFTLGRPGCFFRGKI
jgi:hypothetical protein